MPEHIERITKAYHDFTDVEGFAAVVTNEEIAAQNSSFAINKYVKTVGGGESDYDIAGSVESWNENASALSSLLNDLVNEFEV